MNDAHLRQWPEGAIIRSFRGRWPIIAANAFIAQGAVVIGNVEIGEEANIWYGCVIRGDVHEIRIGPRTNLQDGTVVHVTHNKFGTYIGADVTVGHMALIHACTLEDRAFVGMKACVMDGVVVESEAMVAAGAVVTPGKRIRAGEIWAGSPAKLMRTLGPEEKANFLDTARRYVALSQEHLREGK